MTALNTLIRKASSILKFGGQDSPHKVGLDGEAIFCKNNVCVHPPTTLRTEMVHHPGYLTIKEQTDEVLGSTLILTWIPNTILKKNPRSLENRTPGSSPCRSAHSSSCPSPNINNRSPLQLPYSGAPSPFAYGDRSVEDFSQLCSKSHQSDRRSISSTISDMGSPREDAGSLDSFSTSDHTEMTATTSSQHLSLEITDVDHGDNSSANTATSHSGEKCQDASVTNANSNFQSQSDSGIGPEIVIAALEMMISGLNDMDGSNVEKSGEMQDSVSSSKCNGSEFSEEVAADLCSESSKELSENPSVQVCQSNNISGCGGGDGDSQTAVSVSHGGPSDCCNIYNEAALPSAISTTELGEEDVNGEGVSRCSEEVEASCNLDKDTEKKGKLKLKLLQNFNGDMEDRADMTVVTPEVNIDCYCSHGSNSSSTTPTTSNRDPMSLPSTPGETPPPSPLHNLKNDILFVEGTPESLAHAHNLIFPDATGQNQNVLPKRGNACGVFSVDLSQMRSLRLFFSNKECTCGQLVIASRESQYKILHFHYGGLDRLAKVFEEYNFLSKSNGKFNENCPYHQFSVCRPEITAAECHPEEGIYAVVDEQKWCDFMNEDGVIEDEVQLRKEIFFGGLDPKLRKEAWPFLLHHYSFHSTFDEREQIRNDKYIEYQAVRRKRYLKGYRFSIATRGNVGPLQSTGSIGYSKQIENLVREQMTVEQQEIFWKKVQCTVEKDVVRTDRSNPFFAGNDNPNIEIMKNILLNYAVYNPAMGYTQGMSDLLAPVLAEIQDEAETFWCFVGLMQRTIFVSSPKDSDMDTNLNYLRELFRLMTPKFYSHLQHFQSSDSLELLFVHRWILLCFKREFPDQEAMRMWESCWAHYQTDYFHLFLCIAIVAIYGDDVIAQDLRLDEMLVHFSSLAMHMNGELVLRKARGLLHQFRLFPSIPCTLSKLCELCGPGMWDSGYVPVVKCTGNHWDNSCPYGGLDPSSKHKEAEFLQKLLPGYYMNLNQNPRILLPKFFGLYCYQCGGKNVRLVVMNNLLPSSIRLHEKYDLKSSTYKRKANKHERKKQSPTYKDLDFMECHTDGILLEHETYTALVKTIQRDCRVLESFKIMDYSLLVGIHNVDLAKREKVEQRMKQEDMDGLN